MRNDVVARRRGRECVCHGSFKLHAGKICPQIVGEGVSQRAHAQQGHYVALETFARYHMDKWKDPTDVLQMHCRFVCHLGSSRGLDLLFWRATHRSICKVTKHIAPYSCSLPTWRRKLHLGLL